VDIITPAIAKSWDLSKTFVLMDEFVSKGIVIAGPYKKDLEEINNLRQKLHEIQQREAPQGIHLPFAVITPVPDPNIIRHDAQLNHNFEQDPIWSWKAANGTELGVLDPETIQSAIHSLNLDFLDNSAGIEIDENGWMW
jgi:hypothetical protein